MCVCVVVCVAKRDFICSMIIEGRSSREAALSLVIVKFYGGERVMRFK